MKNRTLIILSIGTTIFFSMVALNDALSFAVIPILISFLIPVQYIAIGGITGVMPVFASLTLQSILVYGLGGISYSLFVFFLAIFSSIMILAVHKEVSCGKIILIGAGTVFLFLFIAAMSTGTFEEITSVVYKEMMIESMTNIDEELLKGRNIEDMKSYVGNIVDTFATLLPSILIISSFLISGFNYYLSSSLSRKMGTASASAKCEFSNFELPKDFFLGVAMLYIFSLIMKFAKLTYHSQFSINIMYMAYTAMTWLGVSVMLFYLKKSGSGPIKRAIIVSVLMFIPLTTFIFPMLGFLELIIGLRKRSIKSA